VAIYPRVSGEKVRRAAPLTHFEVASRSHISRALRRHLRAALLVEP
jgi:hypothetical protein